MFSCILLLLATGAHGSICACLVTSDMCHHDFGGKFRCRVPPSSGCADKTEMRSHPGVYESEHACSNYLEGESQKCYVEGCPSNKYDCIAQQQRGVVYRVSNDDCYKAMSDCVGCLDNPVRHGRDLQRTTCPLKRCAQAENAVGLGGCVSGCDTPVEKRKEVCGLTSCSTTNNCPDYTYQKSTRSDDCWWGHYQSLCCKRDYGRRSLTALAVDEENAVGREEQRERKL